MATASAVSRSLGRPIGHLTRALGLGALTLAVLAAVAPGRAAAGAGASVHLPGSSAFISPATIQQEADVPATPYTLRSAGSSQVNDHAGLSVRKLLALAGANPDTIGFVRFKRPDGTFAYLDRGDLADPPPFPEGPALVWVDGDTSRFFRPVRDDADLNAADNIGTASGEPLIVQAHSGRLLSVSARAKPSKAAATERITFSASVSGEASGTALRYTWTFDDGSHGHGASVSHAFRLAGGYNVFVTVAGNDDSGGSSTPLHIVIGDPPKGPASQPGGGSKKRTAPGGGPVSGGGSGGSTGSTPAPSAPSRSPTAAQRPTSSGTTSTPPRAPGKQTPTPTTPAPAPAPAVSGVLLASSQPVAVRAPAKPANTAATARAGTADGSAELPLSGGVAALLVALGAAGEWRTATRRRSPAP